MSAAAQHHPKRRHTAQPPPAAASQAAALPPPPPPSDPLAGVNQLTSGRGRAVASPAAAQLLAALSLFGDQPGSSSAAPPPPPQQQLLPTGAAWELVTIVTADGLQNHAGERGAWANRPISCHQSTWHGLIGPSLAINQPCAPAPPWPAVAPTAEVPARDVRGELERLLPSTQLPCFLPHPKHPPARLLHFIPSACRPAHLQPQTRGAWRPASGGPARSDAWGA